MPALVIAIVLQHVEGALDQLSQAVNIIQAIFLPFAAIPLLDLTSSSALMGELVNTKFTVVSLWVIILALIGINLYGVITQFQEV